MLSQVRGPRQDAAVQSHPLPSRPTPMSPLSQPMAFARVMSESNDLLGRHQSHPKLTFRLVIFFLQSGVSSTSTIKPARSMSKLSEEPYRGPL